MWTCCLPVFTSNWKPEATRCRPDRLLMPPLSKCPAKATREKRNNDQGRRKVASLEEPAHQGARSLQNASYQNPKVIDRVDPAEIGPAEIGPAEIGDEPVERREVTAALPFFFREVDQDRCLVAIFMAKRLLCEGIFYEAPEAQIALSACFTVSEPATRTLCIGMTRIGQNFPPPSHVRRSRPCTSQRPDGRRPSRSRCRA